MHQVTARFTDGRFYGCKTATAVGRDVNKDRASMRRFAGETAAEILRDGGFGRDREIFCLTGGAFSLVDWIDALLDCTGPADMTVATWTAAGADTARIDTWLKTCRAISCKWIVDRSFVNRQPQLCDSLRDTFGDSAIRVFSSHAKFVTLSTDDGWRVVSMSSANLNHNARVENFHAVDDALLFEEFTGMVSTIFASQRPGDGFEENEKRTRPNKALSKEGVGRKSSALGFKSIWKVPLK